MNGQNISESMNKYLMTILPLLAKQQLSKEYIDYQTKAWLANQLKGYEAWGEQQAAGQQQALKNAIMEAMVKSLGQEAETTAFPYETFRTRGAPLLEQAGVEVPAAPEVDKGQYSQAILDLTRAVNTGTFPSDDSIRTAAQLFGQKTILDWLEQYGTEMRARAENVLREREVAVSEAEVPIRRTEALTGAGRLQFDVGKAAQEQSDQEKKDWINFVKDIEDHLRQEGVKKEAIQEAEIALFGSGKIPDPLTAEYRGQAYTYLGEIRSKLIQGKQLTPGEIRFLQTVRNSAKINLPTAEGGGLVKPETGMTEQELRNRMLQVVTDMIKQMTGVDDEQASSLAREYMGLLK